MAAILIFYMVAILEFIDDRDLNFDTTWVYLLSQFVFF